MRPPLSIAFGSGRAGVGKSTLVANLAVALQRQGYRCLLWDANISAPTLHTLFGVDPLLRAADAYFGRVQPEEVPLELRPGLWLFAERATSSPEAEQLLARHFQKLLQRIAQRLRPDVVLLDLPAGWSELVYLGCSTAAMNCLVLGDDIGSVLDAYGFLKALSAQPEALTVQLIVTNVVDSPMQPRLRKSSTPLPRAFSDGVFRSWERCRTTRHTGQPSCNSVRWLSICPRRQRHRHISGLRWR
jgi:flagellar biosynthesis protein FlhG